MSSARICHSFLAFSEALALREVNIFFRGPLPPRKSEEDKIAATEDEAFLSDPLGNNEQVPCLYFDTSRRLACEHACS